MTFATPFMLSIEPIVGQSYLYGFHLGTDERLARQIAEEKFKTRNSYGFYTRTIALLDGKKRIVDVYDGEWFNQ